MSFFRGLINKGLKHGLFQDINTENSQDIKDIYNSGVRALSKQDIQAAVETFKRIEDEHPSAAYNLGLIYLNGGGLYIPDYSLARKYFQLADKQGHDKARKSAEIIGFESERHIADPKEYHEFMMRAAIRAALGQQFGNLAYVIANDIIYNVILTSTNQRYSAKRFIDYEVWCIRKFANKPVKHFYRQSSLQNYAVSYQSDWASGETAVISDYFNTKIIAAIMRYSGGKMGIEDLGVPRLMAVDCVYKYFSQEWNPDLV